MRGLAILWLLLPGILSAQEVFQIRWPSRNTAPPIQLAPSQANWLPAFRLALTALPEETLVLNSLYQGPMLGLTTNEAGRLQGLFASHYASLRKAPEFKNAPSALPYCFADQRASEGLATVYAPANISTNTRTILFLHGYGGSLLVYLQVLKAAFPEHIIICPAYGISPANIPPAYLAETRLAVTKRFAKTSDADPALIGLSAGGLGAARVYAQNPTAYRRLICIGSMSPSDALARFGKAAELRFINGGAEPYVANGTLRQQLQLLQPRVKSIEWKTVAQADHFFMLSHEEETRKVLVEWERP